MEFFDKSYVMKTMEECDLINRPNYQKLVKHIKENEHLVNSAKEELDYDAELSTKKNDLNKLRRKVQENAMRNGGLNVYEEFICTVQQNAANLSNENSLEEISLNMEKELKSLEMIQAFMKRNKSNEANVIQVDESSLVKANEILKHICEQQK